MERRVTQNEELSVVLESREEEDERLCKMVQQGALNLSDFTHQTCESCRKHTVDAIKAGGQCCEAGSTSGNHACDLWGHCQNPKFTSVRKKDTVPATVVHHCDNFCKQHPKVDSAFTTLLGEDLKSDSVSDPSFSGGGSVASSGSSKALSKASLILSFRSQQLECILSHSTVKVFEGMPVSDRLNCDTPSHACTIMFVVCAISE